MDGGRSSGAALGGLDWRVLNNWGPRPKVICAGGRLLGFAVPPVRVLTAVSSLAEPQRFIGFSLIKVRIYS